MSQPDQLEKEAQTLLNISNTYREHRRSAFVASGSSWHWELVCWGECFCRTGKGAGLSLLCEQPALCHQKENGERMECG